MELATEYRTTERWQSKPVYVKAIKINKLPNSTSSVEAFGLSVSSIADIVDYGGIASYNEVAFDLKSHNNVTSFHIQNPDSVRVLINATTDLSNFSAVVWVKYTKD